MARLSKQLDDHSQALLSMSAVLTENLETPAQQSVFLKEYVQLYDVSVREGVSCSSHL